MQQTAGQAWQASGTMSLLTVNGVDLYWESTGEGPALLFLHGLGSSTCDWDAQVAHFARDWRAIALDLRGHGRSGKPPGPYSVGQFADDVAGFIRQVADAPVHLVGWSMGGMIAFEVALRAPRLLASMTIVNSGPELVLRTLTQKLEFAKRFAIVRLLGMRRMGAALAARLYPEPGQAYLRAQMSERWARNERRAYADSLRALVGWSVMDRLAEIATPTLVVAADQDYTPVAWKRAWAARMPDARVAVVAGSRHGTPVDRPDALNATLEEFLRVVHDRPRP